MLPFLRVVWVGAGAVPSAPLDAKMDFEAEGRVAAAVERFGEPVLSDSEASGNPSTPAGLRLDVAMVALNSTRETSQCSLSTGSEQREQYEQHEQECSVNLNLYSTRLQPRSYSISGH